jgi:hypothetical protein
MSMEHCWLTLATFVLCFISYMGGRIAMEMEYEEEKEVTGVQPDDFKK